MYEQPPSSPQQQRRQSTDRMCTSPSVYASTHTAFKMAVASRERTRSGSGSMSSTGSAQTYFELPVGGVQHTPFDIVRADGVGRFNGAPAVGGHPRTFLIGVAGGTASGKSTVCQRIVESFHQNNADQHLRRVDVISQECFYRKLDENEQQLASQGRYDFDHPDAFDEALMLRTINDIKEGKSVTIPQYDYVKNCGDWENSKVINPVDVILIEGILVFYFKSVREAFNMKLFVDTDADTRLSRRVLRDIKERNRTLDTILCHYIKFVKPAFEEFCLPTKKYADVIIPRGADNFVAIDLIVQHIQDLLKPAKVDLATQMSVTSMGGSTGSFKSTDDRETSYTSAH